MRLLTEEIKRALPRLGATAPDCDPLMVCRFFLPDGDWTWYACEFDGQDIFFGYVLGAFEEWGTFRLSELLKVRGALGLPVERDRHFAPCRFEALGL